jgi:hypothetical protein
MWLHASDVDGVGAVGFTDDVGTGIHTAAQEIADNYVDVKPVENLLYCPIPGRVAFHTLSISRSWFASVAQHTLLWPYLGSVRTFDVVARPATGVLLPADAVGFAALQDDGSAIAVADNGGACSGTAVSTALAGAFSRDLIWASAVEPYGTFGSLNKDVLALGVCANGTSVCDGAVVRDGVARAASELSGGEFNLGASSTVRPVARVGFVPVFSRAADGLFVFGGRDAQSHAVLHDMWFLSGAGQWSKLTYRAYVPGEIAAATYSFGDLKIWAIDRFTDGLGASRIRLMRLDRGGGRAQVVAEWRERHADTRWFLSVDRDGGVLVARSYESEVKTIRFSIRGEPRPVGVIRIGGRLALGPIVDPLGYGFVLVEDDHLLIARRSSLLRDNANDRQRGGGGSAWDEDGPRDGDLSFLF